MEQSGYFTENKNASKQVFTASTRERLSRDEVTQRDESDQI